jgi:site-specific recombinase XerD
MSTYVSSIPLPAKTLTDQEQAALLEVTGQRRGAFRDHVLFALALATGLREHELVALDVGDVTDEHGHIRRRLVLRVFKRAAKNPAQQDVPLSESIRLKLGKFIAWKRRHHQDTDPAAPLFISRRQTRLSTRQVRHAFGVWQKRAGFERQYSMHSLRHAAVTNIYRQTRDIRLAQRFARHKSVLTTMRYSHPDEAELLRAVQLLRC